MPPPLMVKSAMHMFDSKLTSKLGCSLLDHGDVSVAVVAMRSWSQAAPPSRYQVNGHRPIEIGEKQR
jgi:hypothetical protein